MPLRTHVGRGATDGRIRFGRLGAGQRARLGYTTCEAARLTRLVRRAWRTRRSIERLPSVGAGNRADLCGTGQRLRRRSYSILSRSTFIPFTNAVVMTNVA